MKNKPNAHQTQRARPYEPEYLYLYSWLNSFVCASVIRSFDQLCYHEPEIPSVLLATVEFKIVLAVFSRVQSWPQRCSLFQPASILQAPTSQFRQKSTHLLGGEPTSKDKKKKHTKVINTLLKDCSCYLKLYCKDVCSGDDKRRW
jgi:hypothetical protein